MSIFKVSQQVIASSYHTMPPPTALSYKVVVGRRYYLTSQAILISYRFIDPKMRQLCRIKFDENISLYINRKFFFMNLLLSPRFVF